MVTKNEIKNCPKCEGPMVEPMVALSRRDNKTYICPDCGLKEAFADWREHERELMKLEER
jgi:RNase P subunit RPR2